MSQRNVSMRPCDSPRSDSTPAPRATASTRAPSAANRSATARPIPLLAPVTSAFFPCRRAMKFAYDDVWEWCAVRYGAAKRVYAWQLAGSTHEEPTVHREALARDLLRGRTYEEQAGRRNVLGRTH